VSLGKTLNAISQLGAN